MLLILRINLQGREKVVVFGVLLFFDYKWIVISQPIIF